MKNLNYKLFLMPFLFAVALLFSTASVFAQKEIPMTLEIPFEFHVGNKSFSAGNYTLNRIHNGAFLIRSADGKNQVIANAPPSGRIRKDVKSEKIVFNRYGDKYFLRQIFSNRNAQGFSLLKSKFEEVVDKEFARNKSVTTKNVPEQVAIDLKFK